MNSKYFVFTLKIVRYYIRIEFYVVLSCYRVDYVEGDFCVEGFRGLVV